MINTFYALILGNNLIIVFLQLVEPDSVVKNASMRAEPEIDRFLFELLKDVPMDTTEDELDAVHYSPFAQVPHNGNHLKESENPFQTSNPFCNSTEAVPTPSPSTLANKHNESLSQSLNLSNVSNTSMASPRVVSNQVCT